MPAFDSPRGNAYPPLRSSYYSLATTAWYGPLVLGAIFHSLAANSLGPLLASLICLSIGAFVARATSRPKASNLARFYLICFSIFILVSGVVRLFATVFNPEGEIYQNYSDASTLFELSSGSSLPTMEEVALQSDTFGAIFIWHYWYRLLSWSGVHPDASLGVILNSAITAMASVLTFAAAQDLFGENDGRARRVQLFLATSGLMWLFAAFHLRDSFLLLGNAAILWLICGRSRRPKGATAIALIAVIALMTTVRHESVIVGIGIVAAFLVARIIDRPYSQRWLLGAMAALFGLAFLFAAAEYYRDLIDYTLELYKEQQAIKGSLAYAYIVDASPPIRAILGFFYLGYIAVPPWAGFLLGESYHWLISVQALQSVIVLPLMISGYLVVATKWRLSDDQARKLMFIGVFYLLMSLTVAMSTLVVRHIAQFFPFVFVLSAAGSQHRFANPLVMLSILFVVSISLLWSVHKFM